MKMLMLHIYIYTYIYISIQVVLLVSNTFAGMCDSFDDLLRAFLNKNRI